MHEYHQKEEEITFKYLFSPLTTLKAIIYIVIIGLIVFFNVFFNGFVGDDYGQIVDNIFVHNIGNIGTFFTNSTFALGNGELSGIYYRPLVLTTYSFIYALFGSTPFFFHFFQVSLFIVNSVLIFLLLKKFVSKELAFFLAVIFLVHPVNQDTAAYISNLQDTMFFFFGLLGLLFSMSDRSKYQDLKVYSMFLLSLLCKETGIVFLLINLAYVGLFKNKYLIKDLVFSVCILVIYFFLHTIAVGTSFIAPHEYHISRAPMDIRLINIPSIISFYLTSFIMPFNLAINYDWVVTSISFTNFYLPIILILIFFFILFAIAMRMKKDNQKLFKVFVLFIIWFVVGLSLHIQVVPLDGTVSPHWFYFPFVGLLGILGILLQQMIHDKKIKLVILILLSIIITIFSVQTVNRNTQFKDNLTLSCHDVNIAPDNFSLQTSCGASLFLNGSYDDSQKHLEKAVELAPYASTNWGALGTTYGKQAELKNDNNLLNKSEHSLKMAIKNDKANIPSNYENLGYLYAYYGNHETANNFLQIALKKHPNSYKLWLFYAIAEYKKNNKQNALFAINEAYKLNPNDSQVAQFHNALINNIPVKFQ